MRTSIQDSIPTRKEGASYEEDTEPFLPQLGYLWGAEELHSAFLSVAASRLWCGAHPECRGFTTHAPTPADAPTAVLFMVFHSNANVVQSSGWLSWVKPDDDAVGAKEKEEL
jgi:hypothetical protein